MKLAGIVLDISDDPRAILLRKKLANGLPEKIASYHLPTHDDLGALPDRLFGLVASHGEETVRKYAMHDEPSLILSLMYFEETKDLLDDTVAQKTAANLALGCEWYDMEPPAFLKEAILGKALTAATLALGGLDMKDKAQEGAERGRANMEAFRQAQASGAKVSGAEVLVSSEQERALQRGEGPSTGHIWDNLDRFNDKRKMDEKLTRALAPTEQTEPLGVKKADLTGTDAMPQGTLRKPTHPSTSKNVDSPQKVSWQHCGELQEAKPRKKTAAHRYFALPHLERYPIDTASLVKEAAQYFEKYFHEFPLPERRLFAQSVYERAETLGVKVGGELIKHAGLSYGEHLEGELHTRIHAYEGTGHETVYELLLEKKAELEPSIMAAMLTEADQATGAYRSYGRNPGFRDPMTAVYGIKEAAEEPYSWAEGGDYVNAFMLEALATRAPKLDQIFGKDFSASFQKDPVGIFKSLPTPQKVVLSRLAADNGSNQAFRI